MKQDYQLHVIRSVNDPLIAKHYHALIQLVRDGINAEHHILAEKPNYDPSYSFPLDNEEKKLAVSISTYLAEGLGTFVLDGDKLVGVGFSYPVDEFRCMVGPLSVLESHRRQGICKTMIAKLEEESRAKGYKVSILIVLNNNPAKELYQKHGYVTESDVMVRAL